MKRILLICFMLSFTLLNQVWAQTRTVSGKVTSADDNSSLPGVNVVLKGTTVGTVTDVGGSYSLSVPQEGGTLTFSFIGLATQEVQIGNRSVVDVRMASDVKQLGEVVVTALGIEREQRSLGYAVQEIDGSNLDKARDVNIVNSLAGKVAGVQITGASGNMGGSSRILIRGANSITGNNQPLFVVDGVPIDNSNFTSTDQSTGRGGYDYGNAAQDINPDDVESISVLKGASAAALYGTRASNGVILITTKSGKGKKGIGVSVNSGVTFDNVFLLPDYQNEYGGGVGGTFGTLNGEPVVRFNVDESWGPRLDGRPVRQWYSFFEDDADFGKQTPWVAHPDNIKDFFETGTTYNNNVALTGGNDVSSFRLSFTSLNQTFVFPNSNLDRYTVSFNGSTKLTDKLTTSVTANYVTHEALGRPGTGYDGNTVMQQFNQWSQRQMDMNKLRDYKAPDGSQKTWNIRSGTDTRPQYSDNPYWTRYENYQNDDRQRIFGNLSASYALTDNLKLTGRAMTDLYTDRREERIAVGSQAIPLYEEGIREVMENNMDLILSYNKDLTEDFSLNAYVGANRMYRNYNRNVTTTVGGLSVPGFFNLQNSVDRPTVDDYFEEKQINSVFGSASVGFKDMLFLDATYRRDWSSTLPSDNNSYGYPSVTGSFVFSEVLDNASNVLSFGKIRAGYAEVGNDTDPYRLDETYMPIANFGSNPQYSVINTLNNSELKPERTKSYEIGTDVRFFNNRLGVDFTYYYSETVDQIISIAVSSASGYPFNVINAGKMTNQGIELMLTGSPIAMNNGLTWDITLNLARNRNKVVELLPPDITNYQINTAPFAVSVNATAGEPYGVILGFDYERDENGNKLIDEDGYYVTTSSVVPLGNVMADFTGGINNSFSFKGFTLSALIDFQKGGDLFSISNMFGKYSGMFKETVDGNIREVGVVAEGVQADGSPNTVRLSAQSYFQGLYGVDAAHVYDASFVKFREARLGYTFPNKMFGRTPFKNVTLSVVGRNLAILFKNIPHIDPEAALSTGNFQGVEGAQNPSVRSVGFNLNFEL